MGTLAFFPWMTIAQACTVGEFVLRPVTLGPASHPDVVGENSDVGRVLRAYRTPPDIPIREATLVGFAGRDLTDNLSEADVDRIFILSEAVAFVGLSQRQFFSYSGYNNRDSFTLIVQRFIEGQSGISLVQRRRDGHTQISMPEDLWVARKEHHIKVLQHFSLDTHLAQEVLAGMDESEDFGQAIRSFNEANTDRAGTSEAQELVSIVSAFQRLLGLSSPSTSETARVFTEALGTFPAADQQPEKPEVIRRMQQTKKPLRTIWMNDLAVLRGNVGHGHRATGYPSLWSPKEHLLLAAFVFPLLVKAKLATTASRHLTQDEKDELAALDALLASRDLFERSGDMGALQYGWNSVRRDVSRRAHIERALQARGAARKGNGES